MKRAFGYFLVGILCSVIALEIAFRILPVSTSTQIGYYIDPVILTYPPHHEFTTATGWDLRNAQRHRSNNYGFLTSRDFVRDPGAIALIGDSYVEASMLPEADRLGGKLQQLLPARSIYVLGGPGSNLLDYAERVRFAAARFQVSDFVILVERGDVRQVLCGSGNIHGPCLDPTTLSPKIEKLPSPGPAKNVIRHSALAQYVFAQLKVDPAALLTQVKEALTRAATRPAEARAQALFVGPADVPLATVDLIVDTFFQNIRRYGVARVVLIFDCKRDALSSGKSASDPVRDRFMQRAAEYGATVIDTESHFRRFVEKAGLSLAVAPTDAHWNREANRLAAEQVAAIFNSGK
jgi:hypothetical protein